VDICETNFHAFSGWGRSRVESVIKESKERILQEDECLFRDQQLAHSVYLLISGRIRIEKTVQTEVQNYWPTNHDSWSKKLVKTRVLFRIEDLAPYCFIGERECLKVLPMPV